MNTQRLIGFAVAMNAGAAFAEGTAPSAAAGLGQTVFGLAVVVALVFALAWVARRIGPVAAGGSSLLRSVTSLALGPRERVVIVEVSGEWLVLGVTANGISTLHRMPAGTVPKQEEMPQRFAAMFAKALKRNDVRHDK